MKLCNYASIKFPPNVITRNRLFLNFMLQRYVKNSIPRLATFDRAALTLRSPIDSPYFLPRDAKIRGRRLSPLQSISFLPSSGQCSCHHQSRYHQTFAKFIFPGGARCRLLSYLPLSVNYIARYRSPYLRHDPLCHSPRLPSNSTSRRLFPLPNKRFAD